METFYKNKNEWIAFEGSVYNDYVWRYIILTRKLKNGTKCEIYVSVDDANRKHMSKKQYYEKYCRLIQTETIDKEPNEDILFQLTENIPFSLVENNIRDILSWKINN